MSMLNMTTMTMKKTTTTTMTTTTKTTTTTMTNSNKKQAPSPCTSNNYIDNNNNNSSNDNKNIKSRGQSTFVCSMCHAEHNVSCLVVNTAITELIQLGWHLSDSEKKLKNIVDTMRICLQECREIDVKGQDILHSKVAFVRNAIDLERERLIEQVNCSSAELLRSLENYNEQYGRDQST
jgi:hypothetical protein